MFPRMDAICTLLDRHSVAEFDTLPAEVQNLHNLALAFMEVSHPIDMGWRTTDVDDAFPSSRFEFLPPSNVR
nr:K793 [uncultured bacterium]